jgi:phosphotransferase system enzyme I (PtsI)
VLKPPAGTSGELILQGIGVSPGVAVGEAVLFATEGMSVQERAILEQEIPFEIARFEEALIKTRHQIAEIRRKTGSLLGEHHAGIFDAHLLVVDDRLFLDEIFHELKKNLLNVESVLVRVAGRYTEMLSRVEDDYLRERSADVHDVVRRIVNNLAGERVDSLDRLESPCIAVAHDFSPSDTAGMDPEIVQALLADSGSSTSHSAIMARALEIPAVVGLRTISGQVCSGETVLVDGAKGLVIIRPSSERLLAYAHKAEEQKTLLCELATQKDEPSETLDGHPVPIAANIELLSELPSVRRYGANGIGLFRTEFLFLNEPRPPDEEEQVRVYSAAADGCAPDQVVIRTLDLGGDKFPAAVKIAPEENPFLGWRAIRFCLSNPCFFKVQLRAVLRAAAGRNLALMYPMISGLGEVLQANRILEECRKELKEEGLPCAEKIPVGVMIEIPSAALTADLIAPHVDFFSIGTNDLIQYTLAVDRVNENVTHLYRPTHRSVLQLIHQTVQAGHAHRIPVAVCGQMAAAPELAPLLIGLGVDAFSLSPAAVPLIKEVIRNLYRSDCLRLAAAALQSGDDDEVLARCRELLKNTSPEILELIS